MNRLTKIQKPAPRQNGFALFAALILLVIASAASGFFFNRMVSDTRISGATRDNAEAILLAESSMEWLRGRFITNLDTKAYDDADDDPDMLGCVHNHPSEEEINPSPLATQDKCEIAVLQTNMADPTSQIQNFSYIYYATNDGAGITETTPSILQYIANGEASNANFSGCTLASQLVPTDPEERGDIGVNCLFDGVGSFNPFLFTLDDDPESESGN